MIEPRDTYTLNVIIPAYNEGQVIFQTIMCLCSYLREMLYADWRIIVADNGSTDNTADRVMAAQEVYGPRVIRHVIPERGRGRALTQALGLFRADVAVYMDADLSTGLVALNTVTQSVLDGQDLVVGSRLLPSSRVQGRSFKREVLSRGYSLLARAVLGIWDIRDFQCGFKALSPLAVSGLVPLVKDTGWFWDTELIALAKKNGYKVKEEPVTWVDDPDSKVNVWKTAWGDLKGLWRLRIGGIPRAKNHK